MSRLRTTLSVFILLGLLGLLVTGLNLLGQSEAMRIGSEELAFTPAHSSIGQSILHFFGWRPDPVQPIPFDHQIHEIEVGLRCDFCHDGVTIGPLARIPSVATCMLCHSSVATQSTAIQELTGYYDRGEEPPWQRVYGWYGEAHVRFNHAPHIRAQVECETCHGDVENMTVAERVVEHTMGFCVNCHTEERAPKECMTCHY